MTTLYKNLNVTVVPHVWKTQHLSDGSFFGVCLRCKWEIAGKDSDDYKKRQDRVHTSSPCYISERSSHAMYIDTQDNTAIVCNHCGLSVPGDSTAENIRCIWPPPEKEKEYAVHEYHTWKYHDNPANGLCICKVCGHVVIVSSREAAVLLTVREDKNVPCVAQIDQNGKSSKTMANRLDPEYADKCREILEDLVTIHKLVNNDSNSLTVMELHEENFSKILQEAADLVEKYSDSY